MHSRFDRLTSNYSNLALPFRSFPCHTTVSIAYMGAPSSLPIHTVRNMDYLAKDSVRYYAVVNGTLLCQDSKTSHLTPYPKPS